MQYFGAGKAGIGASIWSAAAGRASPAILAGRYKHSNTHPRWLMPHIRATVRHHVVLEPRMLRVFAWCLFALSLLVAGASFAPFTPAISLVVPMAAIAALLAWRGVRLPAALTGVGCLLALWASPLPVFRPGPHWPFTLCALAGLLLLAIALLRPRQGA